MPSLADCLSKAVKGELLTAEESAFVQQKAAAQQGMTKKEAELWAAKDMLRDAIGELDSIARQVGKTPGAPTRKSTIVSKHKDLDAAMAAMLEEHQVVAEKQIVAKREEEQGVTAPQLQAEAELEAAAPGEKGAAKQTRTYEAMREKVIGLIQRQRAEIAAMKAAGAEGHEITRAKLLAALGELNAVMKFMPPEVRGKAGGFFTLAKAEAPLGKVLTERLERVQAELDKLMGTDYRERIEKLIKGAGIKTREGKKIGTLGAEPQTVVDAASKALKMDAEQAGKRQKEIDDALAAGNLTPEQELAYREEWAIINSLSDLKNRSVEHLADVYHQLWDFVSEARKTWRAQQEARMAMDRTTANEIVEGLGKATMRGLSRLTTTDIRSLLRSYTLSHASLSQFIKAILPEGARVRETWWRQAMKAETKSQDQLLAAGERMTAALEAVTGRNPLTKSRALADLKKRQITVVLGDQDFEVSKLEAIQFILSWEQPDVRAKMEPHGWTEAAINTLRGATNEPVAQAMHQFLREEYNTTYELINPVYREMFGINMPKNELYAPARFHNASMQPDLSTFGVPISLSGVAPTFLQARVPHNNPIRQEDAMVVFWQHMSQLTQWTNHAHLLREMRAVMGNLDVRNAIRARHGMAVDSEITRWINTIASQGQSAADDLVFAHHMVGGLINSKALSSLALNWRTVGLQTDSLFRFGLTVPAGRALRAITDRNFLANVPAAFHSPAIQRRLIGGGTAAMRYMFDKAQMTPTIILEMSRMGMMPMQLYDAYLTSLSGAIVYTDAHNEALKAGRTEAEAEILAADAMEEAIWRYSQPIGITNRSLSEHAGGVWGKMLRLFISDPRFKMSIMLESSKELVTGKGEGRAMAFQRLMVLEASAWVSQTVANLMRELLDVDDDDEIWTWQGYALASLLPFLKGFFVIGAVAEMGMSELFGEKWWTPARDPFVESAQRGMTALKNWEDLFGDDDKKFWKEWENIARSLTIAGAVTGPAGAPLVAAPSMLLNFIKPIRAAIQQAREEE